MDLREKLASHPEINWNNQTEEWFCVKCGRTSDHVRAEDAWQELEAFDCAPRTPDNEAFSEEDY